MLSARFAIQFPPILLLQLSEAIGQDLGMAKQSYTLQIFMYKVVTS